jgi:hypothetical protein
MVAADVSIAALDVTIENASRVRDALQMLPTVGGKKGNSARKR